MELIAGVGILTWAAGICAWMMPDALMELEALIHARRAAIACHKAVREQHLMDLKGEN